MTNPKPEPKEFEYNVNTNQMYYNGRWWTAAEARNSLTSAECRLLSDRVATSQPKKRSAPVFKP